MIKILLAVALLTTLNSFGADTDIVPQDYLIEGKYEAKEGKFNNLVVTKWADEYIIDAHVDYGGSTKVTYNVRQTNGNVFEGVGTISVYYWGLVCTYTTDITIKAYTNGLYIKSLLPDGIPNKIVGNTCKNVSYLKVIEKFPYVLKQ